jgi:hypothetical protein
MVFLNVNRVERTSQSRSSLAGFYPKFSAPANTNKKEQVGFLNESKNHYSGSTTHNGSPPSE